MRNEANLKSGNSKGTIAVLVYDYSIKGGAQRVATNVFNEIKRRGYSIVFISVFMKHDTLSFTLDKNIPFFYLNQGEGHLVRTFLQSYKKLSKIVKDNKVSLIIADGYSVDLLASMISLFHKIPMVHWEHTSLANAHYNSDVVSRIYRFVGVHISKVIIALTEKNKAEFQKKYWTRKNKVLVIPNWIEGIENEAPHYNPESKTIVSVGRADAVKGFDRLVEVASIIEKNHNDWEWQIWGDFETSHGKEIAQLIQKKGLDDFIKIKGTTDRMNCIYNNAAMIVLTSYYEGLPMVLIEAKANRLPAISFDIETGPSEIIEDGVNGYLINNNNVDDMANKIITLMDNKEKRIEFSKNTHLGIEKYAKERLVQEWVNMLNLFNC